MRKLFLLEDDLSLISGLTFAFKKQGFALDTARTLAEAEVLWSDRKYDLLVLDVSLPDGSGFDFCQKVRRTSNVPILFLTASDEEMNIIMGLELGGDDYLTKPFKLGVLLSRVNALLRRANASSAGEPVLESGSITVRLLQGQAYKNGVLLELTGAEYKLLCFFMQHPNAVLSKEQILDALWDCDGDYIDSSALTVYIRRLRMKIEDNPGKPQMLLTVRGMGYRLYDAVKAEEIDILINNAGFGAYGATWDVPLETELNMLDLNVRAVQILTKLFLADFRKRGSGRILNVASSAGFLAGPLMSGYYATKGYVLRLSEAISEELRQEGSRVTVTALCPGHVETNFDARAKVRRSIGGVSAKRVAQAGIEGMLRGKVVVLPGALMKMTYVGEKLLPESWMLKIAYRAQARKG